MNSNLFDTWSSLFNHSSFYCLDKNSDLDPSLEILNSRFTYPEILKAHPNRKKDFLLGRLCASKAFEIHYGTELLSLPMSADRSPLWPSEVIGSISHNQFMVGAAVSSCKNLLGLGIDIEVMGRTKLELARYIRSKEDIQAHKIFNERDLLTFIFSAKEALYKALYPTAKCFFGFETAAIKEINHFNKTFRIDLISNISKDLGPENRFQFEGRFDILGKNILSVLEIQN